MVCWKRKVAGGWPRNFLFMDLGYEDEEEFEDVAWPCPTCTNAYPAVADMRLEDLRGFKDHGNHGTKRITGPGCESITNICIITNITSNLSIPKAPNLPNLSRCHSVTLWKSQGHPWLLRGDLGSGCKSRWNSTKLQKSPTWKGHFSGTIATFQDFLAAFPHFEVKQIEVP